MDTITNEAQALLTDQVVHCLELSSDHLLDAVSNLALLAEVYGADLAEEHRKALLDAHRALVAAVGWAERQGRSLREVQGIRRSDSE